MTIPDTRISLLQRLHDRHDSAAWMEFCAVYERVIYRIALRFGLQDADAREVSQEVLLSVSRRIKDFDPHGRGKFRSWLATVARNATIDLLRKRKPDTGDSDLQAHLAAIPDSASGRGENDTSSFDLEARREQFRWAAAQVRVSVAESTWAAFWKTTVEGKSAREVAEDLGITIGTVYVARSRILAKVRALVEPFRGVDGGAGATHSEPKPKPPESGKWIDDGKQKTLNKPDPGKGGKS
ncbi:MAG: RNA polymerase sigma factor [Aureliella sp.]